MGGDTPGPRYAAPSANGGGAWGRGGLRGPGGWRLARGRPSAFPHERLEVDLGVGLAEIEGLDLPRLHELLPDGPGVGQLEEGVGARVGGAGRPHLDVR